MLPDDDKRYAIETCRSSESVLKKWFKNKWHAISASVSPTLLACTVQAPHMIWSSMNFSCCPLHILGEFLFAEQHLKVQWNLSGVVWIATSLPPTERSGIICLSEYRGSQPWKTSFLLMKIECLYVLDCLLFCDDNTPIVSLAERFTVR